MRNRNMIQRLILVALLALCPLLAHAQNTGTAAVTCTAPTTNTDTSAIGGTQLPLKFNFYEGTTNGGPYPNASPQQSACSFTFTGLSVGVRHYFVVTATDAAGSTSAFSNQAQKDVPKPVPNPPGGLTVTNPTAYQPVFSDSDVHFVSVGTLAPDTQCITTVPVKDKFAVPRSSVVSWIGNVRPQFIVATCG